MSVGKLERVGLREVWKHEALDFTTWLEDNVEILNEVLGLDLSSAEREQAAGAFSVDLVAEDGNGNPVVIENQLDKSDHQHLGKLLTYLTALDAKIAVWLVAEPRPEHVRAISWLNNSASADFYIVKVEAVRIGESLPAPLLTLITGPSEETQEVKATKRELAERELLRKRFFTGLLELAKTRTDLHSSLSPVHTTWLAAGAGINGLAFAYVIRKHDARVELYIDRGKDREEENREIFETLLYQKTQVEETFGGPLDWQALENRRACRISTRVETGGYRDEALWARIQDDMVDAMVRLAKALKPHFAKLRLT